MAYDIGPRLGIDGEAEFRRSIQAVNETVRTLGTEMAAVTSAYDKNDKSAAALTSRNEVLVKQVDAQKEKLALLKEGLAASAAKYGENDEKTQRWQQTVNRAAAELARLERELAGNRQDMEELSRREAEAADATGRLTAEIGKQEDELSGLQRQYSNAVLEYGRNSDEARELAERISNLSSELEENRQRLREASGGAEDLGEAMDGTEDRAGGLREALSGLGGALAAMGKAAGAALGACTAAVAGFAKESVSVGMNFDASMSQVAATMGKTTEEIGTLREFALEMGANTAFSASQAAEALNYMALAGYGAEESMTMLPNVLNLAAAGGIELAAASDMVTDAQSALGLTMEGTAELVDKMAKASSKSNTSVAQLGEAILTIGGTAKNLAGGTTELSTALGILADNGVKGAEGGTALRNIILSLSAPTDKAAKVIAGLGVSVYDAAGNMRPLNDTFADLNAALASMTQGERTQALNEIFNKVDLKSVNAMLDTSAERWDELGEAIDGAAGAAQAMADTQMDNLAGDITYFQSALEAARIAVSDGLSPALRDFVQLGTEGVAALTGAFREGGLEEALSALGPVLGEALEMATGMLPEMVSAGAELLGALGTGLMDSLPALAASAAEIAGMLAQTVLEGVPALFEAGAQLLGKLAEGAAQAVPAFLESALPTVLAFTGNLREGFGDVVDAGLELLLGLVQGLADGLPALIEYVPEIVSNIAGLINDNAPKLLAAGIQAVVALGKGLVEAIPALVENIPKIIAAIVDVIMAFNWIDLGGSIIKGLGEGITSLTSFVKEAAGKIAEAVKGGVKELPGVMKGIGRDIVQGVWNGITGMGKWLKDKVKDFFGGIVSGVKDLLGIHSPSRVFREEVGQYISLGVAEGISDKSDKAVKAADKLAKDVYSRSKDWADKQTKYMGLTYDQQIELWETIQSQFISTSKQYSDAQEVIFDLRQKKLKAQAEAEKAIMSELEDWVGHMEHGLFLGGKNGMGTEEAIAAYRAMQERVHAAAEEYRALGYAESSAEIEKLQKLWWNYEDAVTGKEKEALAERESAQKEFAAGVEKIQKSMQAAQEEYLKQVEARTKEIYSSYKLFDKAPERQEVEGRELIDNLAGQIDSIQDFYSGLDALSARGVGEDLVEEIRQMGVGAGDELDALLNMSDAQLSEYAALYGRKQSLANQLALEELEELRRKTGETLAGQLGEIEELFSQRGPDAGRAFADGIAEGLKNGMGDVIGAAMTLANAAADAVKNEMGIASPSKVFARLGGFMAEGLSEGFGADLGNVERRFRRSAAELAAGAVGAPESRSGAEAVRTGGMSAGDLSAVLSEVRGVLDGAALFMDGRRVGRLSLARQRDETVARGRGMLPA